MDEYIENRIAVGSEPVDMEAICNCPICGEPIHEGDLIADIPDLDFIADYNCYEELLSKRGKLQIREASKEDAERLQGV
jgi:hypothetical protein